MRGKVSFEQLWQESVEAQFPKQARDQQNIGLGDTKKYAEEKVDSMRKQKDEELEHYKKEIERAKRFESQKLTGVGGVAGTGADSKIIVKKAAGASKGPIQKLRLNKQ